MSFGRKNRVEWKQFLCLRSTGEYSYKNNDSSHDEGHRKVFAELEGVSLYNKLNVFIGGETGTRPSILCPKLTIE